MILAFKTIYCMKRHNKGNKRSITLKINISKAYNIISWYYLMIIMLNMRFATERV
jgi:hypothetical protein